MSDQNQNTTVAFVAGPSVDATPTPSVSAADVAAIVAMNSTAAHAAVSATAAEPYTVTVRAPEGKGMLAYLVGPGAQVVLQGINVDDALFAVEAGNLRITTKGGAEVLLLDFVSSATSAAGLAVVSSEGTVSGKSLLAGLQEEIVAAKIAAVEPAAGDVVSAVRDSSPVQGRDGFLAPDEVAGGFVSNEGIFSSVIDPFALPITRDAIKIDEFEFELLNLAPFTVNNVIANDDVITVAEDSGATNITPQLLANDSDPQGDSFSITNIVTSPAHGTLSLVGGQVIYTPNANYNGPDSFTYLVTDSQGATDTAVVNINVTPVNDVPVAENDPEDPDHPGTPGNPGNPGDDRYVTGEDISLSTPLATLLANDTDIDGDTLTVISVQNPVNGTVSIVNGNAVFVPAPEYSGPAQYQYTVSDGKGGTASATVFITVTPNSVDAVNDAYTLSNRNPYTMNVLANDNDAQGDSISITSFTQPAKGSVALVNGQFVYTPDAADRGGYTTTFTYTVKDNFGTSKGVPGADDSDTATVTIHVPVATNDVIANDDVIAVAEDSGATNITALLRANDSDPQGDTFVISSILTQPTHGTLSLVNGQVVYTPNANYNGPDSFTYEVTDALGAKDTANVVINVTPVNDVPVAENDPEDPDHPGTPGNPGNPGDDRYVTGEDISLSTPLATLLANDRDIDGDTLTVISVQNPVNGTVSIVNGNAVFVPSPEYSGPAQYQYTVSDGKGGTASATVFITVTPNSVDAVDDTANVAANRAPVTINVLANDTDAQGNTISITTFTQPAKGSVALVNGQFVYTPDAADRGAYTTTFTYSVKDNFGTSRGVPGADDTDTATVTITVAAANNNVIANDDVITVAEDSGATNITATLRANDSDPQGDAFTITRIVTQPTHGTLTLVNGQVVYTPTANYNGPDEFVYEITDALGATDTARAVISVTPVNDVPDAKNDPNAEGERFVTPEDIKLTIPLATLLANDTDADGDTLVVTSVQNPTNGTVELINGQAVFTPNAEYSGPAQFTYTINDGKGGTDTATVFITVTPNSVDAVNDERTMTSRNPLTINVLANDTDAQGDTITITSFTQPAVGTVALVNGQFVYTPAAGSRGAYDTTFTYTVKDNFGTSRGVPGADDTDTATVTIHVPAAANDVDARNDAYTLAWNDSSETLNVLANDVDPQGDAFSITSFTQPARGTVERVGDQFVYRPSGTGYTTTFSYTIRDALGATDTATVTVTVGTQPTNNGGGGGGGDNDDACPLVIDLNGDGITMSGKGVQFDIDGDGTLDTVSNWFGSDDGILMSDKNGNGSVDGIGELFGGIGQDGFSDLATSEDSNGDGIINANDTGWNDLRVWVDANSDGQSQAGELRTLDEFGITAIHTAGSDFYMQLSGDSYVSGSSIVETKDGTLNTFDVWYNDYVLAQAAENADTDDTLVAFAPQGDDVADYNAPAADAAVVLTPADAATSVDALPVNPYNPDQHA